jgi:hypothetical protein
MALDCWTSYSLLQWSKIINCDHPTQPTSTLRRASPDRLPERCLVGRRMVENADQFEIVSVRQRQDPVAGAKTRMESTVEKSHS